MKLITLLLLSTLLAASWSARAKTPQLPGAGIRFVNPSATRATFVIEVKYPSTSSRFEIPVPANGELIQHLELPPYYQGYLKPHDPMPACGHPSHRLVFLTLTGPNGTATIDNCAYAHAIVKARGDAAIRFGAVRDRIELEHEVASAPAAAAPVAPVPPAPVAPIAPVAPVAPVAPPSRFSSCTCGGTFGGTTEAPTPAVAAWLALSVVCATRQRSRRNARIAVSASRPARALP